MGWRVWIGTTADAFYMGLAAVGIALFAVAATRAPDNLADALALGGGLALGAALFTSYGIVPLGLIVLAIAVHRRAWRELALAAAGVVAVFLAFFARGFSWFDGLETARQLQLAGVYEHRPYLEFLVASPAAFALALGPAVAVGLARLRKHGAWLLCGAALAGILFADLSGYARGETERVWLPFAPWLLLAAGAASATARGRQGWLAVQVMAASNPLKHPATILQHLAETLAGDRLHNSTSTTWLEGSSGTRSAATSIQPSAASRIFARASSSVSPSETQPGKAGTSAQKPPSSAG